MKRILPSILALCMCLLLQARDRTLRIDYTFAGDADSMEIYVDELRCIDGWAGRKYHTDSLLLRGNGIVTMRDSASGRILWRNSFSTLFQEWRATEEATRVRKSFEHVVLLPMPEAPAEITLELLGPRGESMASLRHEVDPADILIRPAGGPEAVDLRISGPASECIDVVIVAEGYTAAERELFIKDAEATVEAILAARPFGDYADRFNFRALPLESAASGVSIPGRGMWIDTPLHSHFDTFYSDRYLTTLKIKDLHDALAGVPYEHIIILANTDHYGGGGIFNSYTLTAAHHPEFKPVVVHEFGHSFGGLADEYYYDDQYSDTYFPDCEPWEPNITTKADFASKWQDMVEQGKAGLYEGGGYKSKGVWRGARDCRMKTNRAPGFCPVCQRALERIILFYTEN